MALNKILVNGMDGKLRFISNSMFSVYRHQIENSSYSMSRQHLFEKMVWGSEASDFDGRVD